MSYIYHPQWNEKDRPTVRCPYSFERRIGDQVCQSTCPNLVRVIDEKYRTLIECAGNDLTGFGGQNNITKALSAVAEAGKREAP